MASTPSVPLIPRSVLFGNPERVAPSISPDGTQVGVRRAGRRRAQRLGRSGRRRGHAGDRRSRSRHPQLLLGQERTPPALRPGQGRRRELASLRRRPGRGRDPRPHPVRRRAGRRSSTSTSTTPTSCSSASTSDNPQLHDVYQLDLPRRGAREGRGEPRVRRLGRRRRTSRCERRPPPRPRAGMVILVRDTEPTTGVRCWRSARRTRLTTGPVAFTADGTRSATC